MTFSDEEIVIEKARNGEYTCKVRHGNTWSYIYSQNRPRRSAKISQIDSSKTCVILGLGLGYELQEILNKTSHPVYVIEKHRIFEDFLSKQPEYTTFLRNPRVHFLFENEVFNAILPTRSSSLVKGKSIITDQVFYSNVIKHLLASEKKKKEKVLMLRHPTIAYDCMLAFTDLGYEVLTELPTDEEHMLEIIDETTPDYLFSINFCSATLAVCKKRNIPYIGWLVDSPSLRIYQDNLNHKNFYIFSYENLIVKDLKKRGFTNIFHMPVAVDPYRFNKIPILKNEYEKYASEISFVGTTGSENEYNKYQISNRLRTQTRNDISRLFEAQSMAGEQNILKSLIDHHFIKRFEMETSFGMSNDDYFYTPEDKLSFLLLKKYNEIERIKIIKSLSQIHEVKVYGDKSWETVQGKNLKFMGYAEHYEEMSKIFRISKINLNIIRAYVDSGLPQRVFDILGSKGFLLSNYKSDLSKLFDVGKDLVVFRDLSDLCEIVEYYLHHEDKRLEIAEHGYQTVMEKHTYTSRISDIMKIVKSTSRSTIS
ncbi:MAG: spore maturation protein CgeB [Chlamydiales bacterium]|jgi:spore maturation protein CgeB